MTHTPHPFCSVPFPIGLFSSWVLLIILLKQAKTRQITLTTALLQQTRYPTHNLAIFLLSITAGLRAKEIASLTWDMVTDAEGNLGSALHLRDEASKGSSGRVIPLNKDLRSALQKLHDERDSSPYVITTERAERTSAAAIVNLFAQWYRLHWSQGLLKPLRTTHVYHQRSSHNLDCWRLALSVRMLAGHQNTSATRRYIEAAMEAQKRVVDLV